MEDGGMDRMKSRMYKDVGMDELYKEVCGVSSNFGPSFGEMQMYKVEGVHKMYEDGGMGFVYKGGMDTVVCTPWKMEVIIQAFYYGRFLCDVCGAMFASTIHSNVHMMGFHGPVVCE